MLSQSLVSEVSYRKNVILIAFNEKMIIDNNNEHNYLNKDNYYLDINGARQYLDSKDAIEGINGGSGARIILSEGRVNRLFKLHLGYSDVKKMNYIISAKGNIHDCKRCFILGEEVEAFNIWERSTAIALDYYTLRLVYNGKNKLGRIKDIEGGMDKILSDFSVTIGSKKVRPINIMDEDNGSYLFTFSEPILKNYSGFNGKLSVVSNPNSRDIYGKVIVGDMSVNIINNYNLVTLESFNLISNTENGVIGFRLIFSGDIKIFNYNDFLLNYNGLQYKIGYAQRKSSRVWDIFVYIPNFNQDSKVSIYTSVSVEAVGTRDVNLSKVFIEVPVDNISFGAYSISWNHNNTINNSKVWIYYEEALKLSSLVSNDYDKLIESEGIVIQGDSINISGGTGESDLILDIKSVNYGELTFKHKMEEGSILSSQGLQLGKIRLRYNENINRLDLIFSVENVGSISLEAISSIEYKSSKNIQNQKDIYISSDKSVSQRVNIMIPISGNENPFEDKKVVNGNTLIEIYNNQGGGGIPLIYGGEKEEVKVVSNGDITIKVKERETSVNITVQNMIINGDLILDNSESRGECLIDLENLSGSGTIYIYDGDLNMVSNIDGFDIEVL